MSALRVLFATEDYSPNFIGGQGVWGKALVTHLVRQGVRVTVLAEKRAGRAGPNVILVPFCFANQLVLAFFEYVYFVSFLRHKYFDSLHANQLTALFFLVFRPKNIGAIVVSVHNTWDQMGKFSLLVALESYIFRHADGLLFHTRSEEAYAHKRYQLKNIPTSVVPMGAPKVVVQSRKNNQRVPVVLYIGRLVRRKHVDTLLRALGHLGSNVRGVIIGTGKDMKRLVKMAPSNVQFLGFVEDTSGYFRGADVFVLPSTAEGGVALAAYEAAAYGLPLLLSADSADPNILKNGENGYIIDSTDPQALADNIQEALKHRKQFGAESLRMAKKLTWQKTASGTISFYQQLLGKGANIAK